MYPVLFTLPEWFPGLGGSPISSFGLFLGLSIILGWSIGHRHLLRQGLSDGCIALIFGLALVAGFLGARGLHLAFAPGEWQGPRSLLRFDSEGSSFAGGLALGTLVAVLVALVTRAGVRRVLDALAPGLALGLALTQVGIFLHGSNYGRETGAALGIRYPMWAPADALALGEQGPPAVVDGLRRDLSPIFGHVTEQMDQVGVLARSSLGQGSEVLASAPAAFEAKFQALATLVGSSSSAALVPSPLLAALLGLVVLLGVLAFAQKRPAPGRLFTGAVATMLVGKVVIDATRGDLTPLWGPLSGVQAVGLGLFAVALVLWLWLGSREAAGGSR